MASINSILSDAFHRWAALGRITMILVCTIVVLAAASPPFFDWVGAEKDHKAPVDFGDGQGKPAIPKLRLKLGDVPKQPPKTTGAPKASSAPASSTTPVSTTPLTGFFGPAFAWPIIPIHMALLPDGRVLNFGT
jgi:hypothetical protein